ncbi:MAG TPA: peptide deformylase [Fredinandcohnia sp.]|nr:peptide deformylase [Fredinandcohnia sp.]
MVREILIWPDPRLKEKTRLVERVDDELRKLVDDMYETMYAAEGVGLAANQIGVNLRLAVVDTSSSEEGGIGPMVLINPEILALEGSIRFREGCLSIPGEVEEVIRAPKVRFRFRDLDWNEVEMEATGLSAVAIQHECDHLDGMLYVDRISSLKRERIRKRMKRLKEARATNRG